jgi:acetyl-CoA carboxylase carboxyl transferase subunit alpha
MKKNKLIDDIIPEPLGGAHSDREATFNAVKDYIVTTYKELGKQSTEKLLSQRMEKYFEMGEFKS